MKRLFSLILVLFIYANCTFANDTLRLVFMGDIMQHLPQINAAKTENGTYNYDSCFSFLAKEIQYADFKSANLELTLANAPYSGYPHFSAPDAIAETLKKMGINLLSTANNHCCDRGLNGITRTLDILDKLNLYHVGTYRNDSEKLSSYPQIVKTKNFVLAFLSYTYDTNGIPIPSPSVVNLIDTAKISADIKLAKKYNPDIIICIMHWGIEYQLKQNKEQKMLADFMTTHGVKLVIGSHPHVVQPMVAQTDSTGNIASAIVYSLGNAISNQNSEHTDIGALAHIELVKTNSETNITNCQYSLILRHRPKEKEKTKYYIIPANTFYNYRELFSEAEYLSYSTILENTRNRLNANNKIFTER